MSLAVFGAGYVGLVTSAGLASQGPVVVVDKDPSRVEALRRGVPVFHEPGLTEALTAGQVVFTTDPVLALARAEVAMITVGTPTRPDGGLDTSAVEAVVRSIAEHAQGPIIAVIRSTVPPGTTRRLRPIFEDRAPAGSTLAHVPEFLREGQALADFHAPARVVIGADDPATSERLGLLWGPFAPADKRFHTDPTTAELAKVGANTLLAGRVALVNELARIATATDADLHAALSVIGADPRIGPDYLAPGPGVGGSCLPKDVLGLGALATAADLQTPVVHAIHHSNQQQPAWVLDRLEAALDGLRGRRVAVWGLAFKAGTDDVRDSPALALVDGLTHRGARVRATDPLALDNAIAALGPASTSLVWVRDPLTALDDAEALVVTTQAPQWRDIPCSQIAARLSGGFVLDTRAVWSAHELEDAGLTYLSLGPPTNR